jgi:hypothetical protein
MDELPLLYKLQTIRRPDLYKADWNCILCHKDKETWSHLWQCDQLKPMLTGLCLATKTAMETWISDSSDKPITFTNEWNDLECWQYPSPISTSQQFASLLQGFIPSSLTKALSAYLNKKESLNAIGKILTASKDIFHDDAWSLRCREFALFEASEGISMKDKTSGLSNSARFRSTTPSNTHQTSPSSSSRWMKWITQSLITGLPWMGFRIHINSL